jgi:PII-like signaling protein
VSADALKLTTYFGERHRLNGRLLADELLDAHTRNQLRSSVLLRGIQGFGAKHGRHTDRLLTLSEDLPLVSVAVDSPERIEALIGDLDKIGSEGLVTLERARMHTSATELEELARLGDEPVKLSLYVGRHERIGRAPAFVAVCGALHAAGVAGATVLLGVDGTRHGERHRARFFAANTSVPLMVVAIGEAATIHKAISRVGGALEEPLLTVERVRLCKRDGKLLRAPHEQASLVERHENSVKQKLTIIASEAAQHQHQPIHLELVERLRDARAAGATSVRGIWGFYGDHRPHGDRLLAVRRGVPVMTEIVDAPERISTLFEIVDELTAEQGLVISEPVPSARTLDEPWSLN